jgi:hypothetical protein
LAALSSQIAASSGHLPGLVGIILEIILPVIRRANDPDNNL